jgi:hypothetical protein
MENPLEFADATRRDVLRKAVFSAPIILTLPVIPSFAKAGSNEGHDQDDQGYQGHQGDQDDVNIGGGSQSDRRRRRHRWWFLNW